MQLPRLPLPPPIASRAQPKPAASPPLSCQPSTPSARWRQALSSTKQGSYDPST